jgi:hypothetical protein
MQLVFFSVSLKRKFAFVPVIPQHTALIWASSQVTSHAVTGELLLMDRNEK